MSLVEIDKYINIHATLCMGACIALPSCTHSRPYSFLQRRRARPARECRMWELSTVVSRPVFNMECAFSLIYLLKFEMAQNPKQGLKNDLESTPFFLVQSPPKCHNNTINWLCPLKSMIIKHKTVDWRKICLIFILFSLKMCSAPQGPHQRQSKAESFHHWCLPCTCCLTGLNCYNVTSGSAICNNVTSSSAMQVCMHGFTNLVSLNVMTKWNY